MIDTLVMITVGLVAGATVALTTSSFWLALNIPLRIQAIFDAGSPKLWVVAITLGMTASALTNGTDFTLFLPEWVAMGMMVLCGGFVGMLASALGKALDVIPNLLNKLQIRCDSKWIAGAMVVGKTLGVVVASLLYPF